MSPHAEIFFEEYFSEQDRVLLSDISSVSKKIALEETERIRLFKLYAPVAQSEEVRELKSSLPKAQGGVEFVAHAADKEFTSALPKKEEITYDETQKIILIKENLQLINEIFSKLPAARERFIENFPGFSSKLEAKVNSLYKIADRISKDRHNYNLVKVKASYAGIIGGMAIGASVYAPVTAGLMVPVGALFSIGGAATSFGLSIGETLQLRNEMGKARSILEDYKSDLKQVTEWLEHAEQLTQAIENIIGFTLLQKITDDITKVMKETGDFNEALKNNKLATAVRKIIKQVGLKMGYRMDVVVEVAPMLLSFLFAFALIRERNPFLFESVMITVRIILGALTISDLTVDAAVAMASAVTGGSSALTKAISVKSSHAIFAGVSIVLDSACLYLTKADMKRGSKCEEAKNLKEAADKMKAEYKLMEELHETFEELKL